MSELLCDIFSLAWMLGLGALTLVAGFGAAGVVFSGGWLAGLALSLLAATASWVLARGLRGQRERS